MLRLAGFFVAVLVLLAVLRQVPFIGGLFDSFIGFWVAAILLSVVLARAADWGLRRRKLAAQTRSLGHVESAHNQGKLGALLLSHGRVAEALPHLERAAEGEPEIAEWHFRRGLAALELGRSKEAIPALERAAAIDDEHAYGAVQLALARAHVESKDATAALAALDRFDRNHGPNPESSYRRGLALKLAGRSDEARRAMRQVGELARNAARFQRANNRRWIWRAWLAGVR